MKLKKLTLIDGIIILAVLIAGIIAVKVMIPDNSKTNGKVNFVVMADCIDNEVADHLETLKPGSKVTLSHSTKTTVTINSVTAKPHKATTFNNSTNEYVQVDSQDNKDLYIDITANADITKTGIQCGDVFIRVGNLVYLSSKDVSVSGYIIEIPSEQ